MTQAKMTGGAALVAALKAGGVDMIFCVPGESYLAALDALVDSGIRVITCRHEGGAAFMAEAYAKLTGKTGVCFVTRGPGACNASIGLHTAKQDSTPFLLLIGQVARADRGREAFQEVDYRQMFGHGTAKKAYEAESADELPALFKQALEQAQHDRPGPIAISLPEDVLTDETAQAAAAPLPAAPLSPAPAHMAQLRDLLLQAKKPLLLAGGGWSDAGSLALQKACERLQLPVVLSFRRQDVFDNLHACYAGTLGTTVDAELLAAVRECDLIIAVGTRINDISTQGYTLLTPPRIAQKLVHVYPQAQELGRVFAADVAIHADSASFAAALGALDLGPQTGWDAWCKKLHDRYLHWSTPGPGDKYEPDLDGIITVLRDAMPEDTIITTDAGNFSGWAQRYWRYRRPGRLLAPTAGAMGYGVPAAVAVALAAPKTPVVGFMGDGGFLMTAQEIATAVQFGATPILLVFDNGMYGTIRMHQEKHYPGRVSATELKNPDFAALAEAYGAAGFTVTKTADFTAVLHEARRATQHGKPAVIHIRMDREQLTTGPSLSAIRAAAQKDKQA